MSSDDQGREADEEQQTINASGEATTLAPTLPNQASSAGEGLLPLALTARGTGGGSATGAGLVVAPRRLTAFAMRVAAETRAEWLRAAGVVVEAALRRFLVGLAAAAVAGMAAPSEVGLSPVDCGVAFASVEVGCDALALDWAALGLVTLGLVALGWVALVLADSFAGEADAFRVVRAGLLGWVERLLETLSAPPAERLLVVLEVLSLELASASVAIGATRLALAPRRTASPRVLPADLRDEAAGATARVRWESTKAHSSSLRLAGLAPWAWATRAAFSMSATRLLQEVAKRLSDWDLAPLSTRVSITPAADTFLRRRLKISFWSWAIRASALSLSVIVS